MQKMRRNILDEMNRMQRRLDSLFGNFLGKEGGLSESPEGYREAFSELKENDNEYIVEIELPGVNKNEIELKTTDTGLEVKATKKQENEEGDKENGYSYSRSYSGFYEAFDVPENADLDNIDASYNNGVLTVKLPKKQKDKDKKEIQIK